jgi:DNA helicase-2/ATP-dependent DNA helicase PcrA
LACAWGGIRAVTIGRSAAGAIVDAPGPIELVRFLRHTRSIWSYETLYGFRPSPTAVARCALTNLEDRVWSERDELARGPPHLTTGEPLIVGYVDAKQHDDVLDYDDLLLYWREAARTPAIAAQMWTQFDHILVDEYQDTNRLQADILLSLAPDGAGLTVVGDDAQSIYGFRAATVRNILEPNNRRSEQPWLPCR